MFTQQKVLAGIMLVIVFVAHITTGAVSKAAGSSHTQPVNKEHIGVVVTMDNFIHADSTRSYLKELANTGGKVNVVRHGRKRTDTDNQDVIRMNDDTLYARVILDVKGGATISTKDYEGYQNINVLDINHSQIASLTGKGTLKLDESMLTEGQHVYAIVRTGLLRDLSEDEMMTKVHRAQDNISITYQSSEPYIPSIKYDFSTLNAVKYQIFENFAKNPLKYLVRNAFGKVGERDEASARIVIAVGWGGMPGDQAVYSPFSGNGERRQFTIDRPNLKFGEKAFFSLTTYNKDGWIATKNYSINSDDMVANENGTFTITFLASGEPVKEGEKNVLRTPRGKIWTGVLRAYYPVDKIETYDWADNWTKKMTKEFRK